MMIAIVICGWLFVIGPGFEAHLMRPDWCAELLAARSAEGAPLTGCHRLIVN